jgi:OOP family OmpA-OmpF porin
MSNERDILKSLLLKEELELLDTIKKKLLTEEQFTREVSNVVAEALKRAQYKDKNIERALAQPIKEGVKRVFVDSKQSIIDSLLPIMGQLIRKTVTNSIKQFVSDINRILEQKFSVKYIKWRWQAFRTGSSLAQIVFQNTVHYQVSEIFLINSKNGLLIQHVGADDMLKDNNAISGMLTAIQDFVGDSFNESDSQLESIEIKGKQFLFSFGPKAYMAAVVQGSPTERLKEKLQQLIENAHGEFSKDLSNENNYDNLPDLNDFLRSNLVTKSLSPETKSINWLPWAIIVLLLSSYFIYTSYNNSVAYSKIVTSAESIDGFILQDVKAIDSGYKVTGLLDPQADVSPLVKNNITLSTKAYISLDANIIKKRIANIIDDYPEIKTDLIGNTLTLNGIVSQLEYKEVIKNLDKIIGVEKINNQLIINKEEEIISFLNQFPQFSKESTYDVQKQTLVLNGEANQEAMSDFESVFKTHFPKLQLDDSNVLLQDSTNKLLQYINNSSISLSDIKSFNLQNKTLNKIIKNLHQLLDRGLKIQIEIIGESDCFGSNSNQFSLQRAELIKQIMLNQNIDKSLISTKIKSCKKYTTVPDASLLKVSFKTKEIK